MIKTPLVAITVRVYDILLKFMFRRSYLEAEKSKRETLWAHEVVGRKDINKEIKRERDNERE